MQFLIYSHICSVLQRIYFIRPKLGATYVQDTLIEHEVNKF